ncbi:tetratricopeptide repeat protein [Chloroflexota bacterium]
MGQISRCPLTGLTCNMPITMEDKSFFLAETLEPENERKWRWEALATVLERENDFKLKSALEENDINAFTCKICEMIQTCAYGIADITSNNPNVLFELGMMIALGKPTIILVKIGQQKELKLPSDIVDKEVIPFQDYTEIMPRLRKMVGNLPAPQPPQYPIDFLEKLQPQLAEELKKMGASLTSDFKASISEAKLETISEKEKKIAVPHELNERLKGLEEKLEYMTRFGFVTDVETALLRGNYFYNQEKYEEAFISYNWALELEPDRPETLYNRGNALDELERYEEALADYDRSLEIELDDPETLNNRGITLCNLERYEEALTDFNRSLEIRPDNPGTLYNRGNALDELERYEEALADYFRSLEIEPDDPETLNERGITLCNLERYEEALADFNRSLEIRPDNPGTLNGRGITLCNLERFEDALADYNRSLEFRPDNPGTVYNIACLYSLLNNPNEAIENLGKAIHFDNSCREEAKTDSDFDNIREDPRFKELMEPDS